MSLAIFQSKFVLVGGRHLSTLEPTNMLLTSTTGRQWEPSLPPMPTKRYKASSMSTRSPEVLVVAGGQVSLGEQLDVVEVLRGKWVTIDPFPEPCSCMLSAFHDGKLYFMKREVLQSIVFTCRYTSLISASNSSSCSTSTDGQLWRQFQAPSGRGASSVSFSSRLVCIDYQGRLRGYSGMAQSWIAATTTGPTPNRFGATAATVTHSGELIFTHESGGVYRGTVLGKLK